MTIADLMTTDVESIAPEAPLADARAMMRKKRIHHLVVTRAGNILGIVSARDLNRRSAAKGPDHRLVEDVMNRHVLTVPTKATVGRASFMMRGWSVGCLVVLERGRLAGIVTAADLLGRLAPPARRRKRADTRTAVHHRVPHRPGQRGGVW